MIVGRFYGDVPHVVAELHLRRLGKQGVVHFLVDTGAGHSLIHPGETKRLGLNLDRDFQGRERSTVGGIGGGEEVWVEEAEMTFCHHDGQETTIDQPIRIAVPTDDNGDYPSLLGRDVLHRFVLFYSFPQGLTLSLP